MRSLSIRARVVIAVLAGAGVMAASASTALALGPPVNTGLPTISGTAQQGQTVHCSTGTWLNSPTSYSYTWQRDLSNIGGATSSSYTLTSADVNHLITCTVVAHNADGDSLPATSLPITPSALPPAGAPINTGLPTISGTAQEGQTVSCSTGTWQNNPTSYSYTWQRDLSNIGGATSSSYTLTSADVNHAITCTVVAHNSSGDSLPATSLPITPTAPPPPGAPANVTAPAISPSSAQVGQTVSCSPGTWDPAATSYSYTWQRDGTDIAGATASSYQVVTDDADHQLTCTVVAHNDSGDSAPAVSAPIVPTGGTDSAPQNTALPTISGTAEPGHQLSCSKGSWDPVPDAYAYKWLRNGSPIAGASSNAYAVAVKDVGQQLQCRVFASNQAGWSVATSAAVVPADKTPPAVSSFGVTNKRFAVGHTPTAKKGKVRRGTRFVFGLSEPAGVAIKIQCVRAVGKARHRARCPHGGKLSADGSAGANKLPFSGRIGKRALKPARYRATLVATDAAGNASKARSVRFVVVKSRHRR